MSLTMRPLAPHLEESTANDDGKIPSLVAEPSVPIKDILSVAPGMKAAATRTIKGFSAL
jgi:hypothetical protein